MTEAYTKNASESSLNSSLSRFESVVSDFIEASETTLNSSLSRFEFGNAKAMASSTNCFKFQSV